MRWIPLPNRVGAPLWSLEYIESAAANKVRFAFPPSLGRVHSRACWAALLAAEVGYSHVLVLSGGHCAWVYDPDVRAYAAYTAGEPPPEPEEEHRRQELEFPDHDEGLAELGELDLVL